MKANTNLKYTLLIAGTVLGLLGLSIVATGSNIDPANKYAWSTNAGWISFNPSHGGVTVYSDHLEGYAWAENVGWIRMGSHTGGGAHTYANTTNANYGVNVDGSGVLSGYAWSTNLGWIKFDPTHGAVTIDLATGSFDGYAWGENVGWVHFKNTSPAYNVVVASYDVYLPVVLREHVSYYAGPWEREDNDTYQQANGALYSGQDYQGYPDDTRDYFSIYLRTGGDITVDLTDHTGSGTQLQLFYQSVDNRVASDLSAPYHIEYPGGSAGWYYVYIYAPSGHNSTTPYTLRVTYP